MLEAFLCLLEVLHTLTCISTSTSSYCAYILLILILILILISYIIHRGDALTSVQRVDHLATNYFAAITINFIEVEDMDISMINHEHRQL